MPRPFRRYLTSDKIPYTEFDIEEFVYNELQQYRNKAFKCDSLGVNVIVTDNSIKETAHNCRWSRQSAALALKLPYVVENAKIYRLHLPTHSNTQRKKFGFTEIAILTCNVKYYGIAKLTVGYKFNGKVIEYAITSFKKSSQFID